MFAACVVVICGCGGSNSTDTQIISIRSDRFDPKTVTVDKGSQVRWVNTESQPHKIVSGVLDRVANPQILPPISIRSNDTFDPNNIQANFGDTLRWRNDRLAQFNMEILDDAGTVIATIPFDVGEEKDFSGFPSAGRYTYRQVNNFFFSGTATLFGIPNPNGLFESTTLNFDDSFMHTFDSTGVFPYYDLNQAQPNRSFITGTVVVQ